MANWLHATLLALLGWGGVAASGSTPLLPAGLQSSQAKRIQIPVQLPQAGADQPERYLPLLRGQRLGLVANPSSRVGQQHLVDFLQAQRMQLVKVFAPEHGFRGEAEAGAQIVDGRDPISQLPVISLYGEQKQPTAAALADLDLLVFDIQDVGVRYYTYISTLHYVMEACAQHRKPLLILDRPNPNGAFIDGPVLQPELRSFVGLHPIPLLHGLTVGELAQMINGENWLQHGSCELNIVPVANYRHSLPYDLPVPPSPNLPNAQAIGLYPSLGLFEGSSISVGRGTAFPFQVLGAPDPAYGSFQFRPVSLPGFAAQPMHQDQLCYGRDLRQVAAGGLQLRYLLDFYARSPDKARFFNPFFDKLAGTYALRQAIETGKSEQQIRQSWKAELSSYRHMRQRYLLYPD